MPAGTLSLARKPLTRRSSAIESSGIAGPGPVRPDGTVSTRVQAEAQRVDVLPDRLAADLGPVELLDPLLLVAEPGHHRRADQAGTAGRPAGAPARPPARADPSGPGCRSRRWRCWPRSRSGSSRSRACPGRRSSCSASSPRPGRLLNGATVAARPSGRCAPDEAAAQAGVIATTSVTSTWWACAARTTWSSRVKSSGPLVGCICGPGGAGVPEPDRAGARAGSASSGRRRGRRTGAGSTATLAPSPWLATAARPASWPLGILAAADWFVVRTASPTTSAVASAPRGPFRTGGARSG